MTVVSKSEFAEIMNVTRQRVSQWLGVRQIDGDALVGEGRTARINVEIAKEQLSSRLSVSQHLGANGKALLNGGASPIDTDIKSARLRQLMLSNERASADAALRAGIYVKADDVSQQFGAVASRLMTSFEFGIHAHGQRHRRRQGANPERGAAGDARSMARGPRSGG